MNTYSSLKRSFDSQIQGRKIQEPNVAITSNRAKKSPRLCSPEQTLDQFIELKPQHIQQTLKKKKVIQGQQGKSKSQINTAKKGFFPSQEKKLKKSIQQQTKKKSNTLFLSNSTSPQKQMNPKKHAQINNIGEMLIKQQINKQNLQKDVKQLPEKKNLNNVEKRQQSKKEDIQLYINCKRAQDTINLKHQEIQMLLEQKKKIENLVKLDQLRKKILSKQKTIDARIKSPKKGKKKLKKNKQKEYPDKILSPEQEKPGKLIDKLIKRQEQHTKMQQNQFQLKYEQQQNKQTKIKKHIDLPQNEEEHSLSYMQPNDQILPNEVEETLNQFPPSNYLKELVKTLISNNEVLSTANLAQHDFQLLEFYYMQAAATKIQSVWRGFYQRKLILDSYLRYLEQEDQLQQENGQYQNSSFLKESNQSSSPKVANPPQSQNNSELQYEEEEEEEDSQRRQLDVQQAITKILKKQQDSPQNQSSQSFSQQQSDDLVVINQVPRGSEIEDNDNEIKENGDLQNSIHDHKISKQESIIQEIQHQLNDWNFNLENLITENRKSYAIKTLKEQMQQAIITIVQSQIQKFQEQQSKQQTETEQSVDFKMRLSQETNTEKNFNDIRKKFKSVQEQSEERLLQSSKDQSTDINRSSLLALQSQLMRREIELLSMREEAIQLRYQAEIKKNENDDNKKSELNLWLKKELEDLQQTRQAIEISTKKEASAMKKIQRDLIIAQSFDENNSKLQSLRKRVDEQLSNLKQSKQSISDIKLINNFCIPNENELEKLAETQSEDFNYEEQFQQKQFLKDNFIESYETIEKSAKVNLVVSDLVLDLLQEMTEELFLSENKFDILIQTLIRQSIIPQIPTSIIEIRYYIHNLFDYILPQHYYEIIKNINLPYGFSPQKRLQFIHGYMEQDESQYNEFLTFVLKEEYFLEYEQYRLQQNEAENEDSVTQALKELEHIHNRAIFDACNEALNFQRPYYCNSGSPYPWEGKIGHKVINDNDLSEIFKNMELKVVQWANSLCGLLPVEEEIAVSKEKQVILDEKNQQIMLQQMQYQDNPELMDQDYQQDPISQIREQRLYKALIQDFKDLEYRWNQDQDDKAELLMEIGDLIFEQCIEEFLIESVVL
ncbi:unnamed protein product (macronuclear) [Paramecium tetraurelia]|uniref:DUF4378 domain-containing protein n=1 Tax=Paramecium tetraurelia TaxID=5888 RepID=A0CIC6_PARTE|nr:uncharacterized protein GSPATT00007678001 [Paramecium tetraurelia]CAK70543.1 unnamed protein product [Paramecium tetraurelia]|eukprot:XP_001437940.1 hypothetical protein (macronuclear) [Paramecium tetraurelia strain d4-2]